MKERFLCAICRTHFYVGFYRLPQQETICFGCHDRHEGRIIVIMGMRQWQSRGYPQDGQGNPVVVT